MTRSLRKRYGARPTEALWRDAYVSGLAGRLRKRSSETSAEAL